jgi:phosphotransferase system enzyme I (PtsI)
MIPELKQVIRSLDMRRAKKIAAHTRQLDFARDIDNYLRGELHKICPEYAQNFEF